RGAAVEALLFARDGQENDGGRKFVLTEDAGALQRDRRTAAVIVRPGRRIGAVHRVLVAGVIVSGDQIDTLGLFRIGAAQDGIHVFEFRRLRNTRGGRLDKGVSLHLQAAAARGRV